MTTVLNRHIHKLYVWVQLSKHTVDREAFSLGFLFHSSVANVILALMLLKEAQTTICLIEFWCNSRHTCVVNRQTLISVWSKMHIKLCFWASKRGRRPSKAANLLLDWVPNLPKMPGLGPYFLHFIHFLNMFALRFRSRSACSVSRTSLTLFNLVI